jgi:hypothetical protein
MQECVDNPAPLTVGDRPNGCKLHGVAPQAIGGGTALVRNRPCTDRTRRGYEVVDVLCRKQLV